MAIEMNTRTKILAGVVVLAAAGAGAWFFFLQDFLSEPPPAPKVAAAPAKPAAEAAKAPAAAAAKGPADAPKAGDAPKAADAPKSAEAAAPKPAATAAGKPIPTNPDQLIAEVIEVSGLKSQFSSFGEEAARGAVSGGKNSSLKPEELRAISEAVQRNFDPAAMTAEFAANLKNGLDAERMARFLEILRQPVAQKMTSQDVRRVDPEEFKAFVEKTRKEPLPAARLKLIQTIDGATRNSEAGSEFLSAMVGAMLDSMFAELAKAGKKVPADARRAIASQLNGIREQARARILNIMYFQYRDISDEDLAAYVKLIDTDTGRWGGEQLVNAARPVLVSRFSANGKDIAKIMVASRAGTVAKAPAEPAPEPLVKAQSTAPAEKPAAEAAPAAAPAAPAEPVGYRRPANIKTLYSRYNDLISATVMRDGTAVKELLDDGKFPDPRQADGLTPLMIAASNGDTDLATMLLSRGANPNLRATGGTTALSLARSRGAAGAAMVQLLQRNGAKD